MGLLKLEIRNLFTRKFKKAKSIHSYKGNIHSPLRFTFRTLALAFMILYYLSSYGKPSLIDSQSKIVFSKLNKSPTPVKRIQILKEFNGWLFTHSKQLQTNPFKDGEVEHLQTLISYFYVNSDLKIDCAFAEREIKADDSTGTFPKSTSLARELLSLLCPR